MVDIVEEEIELHLIDTRDLVEEAKKLKQLERIKKRQNDLLKKSPSQLREEKAMLKRLNQQSLSKGVSPLGLASSGDVLPKGFGKEQTRAGAIKGQNTSNAFRELQKKIKELEKKQKKAIKKVNEFQEKFVDKIEGAQSFLTSGNLTAGGLGVLGGIGARFGPIGIAITTLVTALVSELSEQFDRGGIFSTKLPITEREKNIADVDFVNDVRSGTKFLTSDLRIAQKAPDTSNTLNLRYEHIRYTSQELGK